MNFILFFFNDSNTARSRGCDEVSMLSLSQTTQGLLHKGDGCGTAKEARVSRRGSQPQGRYVLPCFPPSVPQRMGDYLYKVEERL